MSDGRSTRWDERREQISECIRSLHQEGINPTIRLVREVVGGSPNLVSELLREWRKESGVQHSSAGPRKGSRPWNVGLTKGQDLRLARPGNGRNFLVDEKPWNYQKGGYETSRKGKPLTDEHKKSLSGFKPGRFIGECHWKWSGGSGRRYWRGSNWSSVKKEIIERDQICFRCGVTHDQWFHNGVLRKKNLSVHHFNPWPIGDNAHENLVLVCVSCHMILESNQDENQKIKDQVSQKYGYS